MDKFGGFPSSNLTTYTEPTMAAPPFNVISLQAVPRKSQNLRSLGWQTSVGPRLPRFTSEPVLIYAPNVCCFPQATTAGFAKMAADDGASRRDNLPNFTVYAYAYADVGRRDRDRQASGRPACQCGARHQRKKRRIAHTKTNEHTETHSASRFTVRMFVADASSDSGSLFTGKGG